MTRDSESFLSSAVFHILFASVCTLKILRSFLENSFGLQLM